MKHKTALFLTIGAGLALTAGLMLTLSGFGIPKARAASFTVCPAGPPTCNYSVIQDAVDAAGDGDVIKVAAGTYADVNNYGSLAQVVYINKTVTIQGGYTADFIQPPDPAANPTTLDAGGQGRVIYIEGNTTPTIEGLRITGGDATTLGSAERGGGVQIAGSAATLRQNVIFNNTAGAGGGVDMSDCAATLEYNTIISNTANSGGGLWMWQCDNSTLRENTISFNTAYTNAGGLWSGGGLGNININDNVFANNTSGNWAGGLELQGQGYSLVGNTISSNEAIWAGGMFLLAGEFTLTNNDIISNTGGGVDLSNSANTTFIGNDISYNIGKGLSINGDNISIQGNVISHNSAEWGAGISSGGNNIVISENTISHNHATRGGGGFFGDGPVTLAGNSFLSNTAEMGAGLLIPNATGAQIARNTFSGNHSSSQGGGLDLWGGNPVLTNNIIVDNQSDGVGSAIHTSESSLRLLHNTIARNTGGDGSGIFAITNSSVFMTNTLIVSHTVGVYIHFDASASIDSTLWGNGVWSNGLDWDGAGAINHTNDLWGDPEFVGYLVGDYHIGENSDGIDAGIDAVVTVDFDNLLRPYLLPDLGADEYWPPGALKFIYLPVVLKH